MKWIRAINFWVGQAIEKKINTSYMRLYRLNPYHKKFNFNS